MDTPKNLQEKKNPRPPVMVDDDGDAIAVVSRKQHLRKWAPEATQWQTRRNRKKGNPGGTPNVCGLPWGKTLSMKTGDTILFYFDVS